MNEIENKILGARDALVEKRRALYETLAAVRGQIANVEKQIADCAAAARVFGLGWPDEPSKVSGTGVRGLVLSLLQTSGDRGSKSSDMRPIVEQKMGKSIHPKTVGITLYRLLQDGEVTRSGHMWFIARPLSHPEQANGAALNIQQRAEK